MYGWSFAARTVDELDMLLSSLGRHRYLAEVDLRLHWSVDLALSGIDERFLRPALEYAELRASRADLDPASLDLALWRSAEVGEVIAALGWLWLPGPRGQAARDMLSVTLREAAVAEPGHQPFASDPEAAAAPELVTLDWTLLPVDALDPERHAGALEALARAEGAFDDAFDDSEPVYIEGPTLCEPELVRGATRGVLPVDPMFWAEGPYAYCDYVLCGVARAAGLVDPPIGWSDIDKM
jgi:hypothetical protein